MLHNLGSRIFWPASNAQGETPGNSFGRNSPIGAAREKSSGTLDLAPSSSTP